MISLLVTLLIICLVFAIFWWILSMIPVPPQFKWVVQVVAAIVLLIFVIEVLTGGVVFFPHGAWR